MSTLKSIYGTSNQPITVTLSSLANTSYRQSVFLDNSSNLYLDILLTVKIKGGASNVAATGQVQVFAAGSTDGGTSYDGSCTGTDTSYTPPVNNPNLERLGAVNITSNAAIDQRTFSVAQAFGGTLPQKIAFVFFNNTGSALDSGTNAVWYQGVQAQTV